MTRSLNYLKKWSTKCNFFSFPLMEIFILNVFFFFFFILSNGDSFNFFFKLSDLFSCLHSNENK